MVDEYRVPYSPKERWYDSSVKGEDLAEKVFAEVNKIEDEQHRTRRELARMHFSLYEGRELLGFEPGEYGEGGDVGFSSSDLKINVVQSCVDTLVSKLGIRRSRPMFLTDGGDPEERRRAKAMSRFVIGNFMADGGFYQIAPRVFKDACVGGTGIVHPYVEDGKIRCDRVWPLEIIVDEQAALDGDPRPLFRRKWLPADTLASRFPKFEEAIYKAATMTPDKSPHSLTEGLVEVVAAYHLRSGPKAKDGRRCICVNGETISDELAWKADKHVFVPYRWCTRTRGWHGQGLAEQLHGIQDEINTIVLRVQAVMGIHAVPWLLKHISSKIASGKFTNKLDSVIEWEGSVEPKLQVFATSHPEVYNHLWALVEKAYEISGLSLLSATSQKPKGIDSGVAVRNLQEVETVRFAEKERDIDEFSLELARRHVNLAKEHPELRVKFVDKKRYFDIKWSEVDLSEDRYVLKLHPANLLPETPTGKMQRIDEMVLAGTLQPEQGQALMDFPDLEAFQSMANAAVEVFDAMIEDMLERGDAANWQPEPWMNLPLGIAKVQKAWCFAKLNGYPEDRLDLLVAWMRSAKDQMDAEQARMAALQQAAAGMPGNVPMAFTPPTGEAGAPPQAMGPGPQQIQPQMMG